MLLFFYYYSSILSVSGVGAVSEESHDQSEPGDRVWPEPAVVEESGVARFNGLRQHLRPITDQPIRGTVREMTGTLLCLTVDGYIEHTPD